MVVHTPWYRGYSASVLLFISIVGGLDWIQVIDSDDGSPEDNGRMLKGVAKLDLGALAGN